MDKQQNLDVIFFRAEGNRFVYYDDPVVKELAEKCPAWVLIILQNQKVLDDKLNALLERNNNLLP